MIKIVVSALGYVLAEHEDMTVDDGEEMSQYAGVYDKDHDHEL